MSIILYTMAVPVLRHLDTLSPYFQIGRRERSCQHETTATRVTEESGGMGGKEEGSATEMECNCVPTASADTRTSQSPPGRWYSSHVPVYGCRLYISPVTVNHD